MTFRAADVSEYQSSIDWTAYRQSGLTVAIARAHNGYRADRIWPARRDDMRTKGFDALGWYHFLVSDVDPVQQAKQFIATVGPLQPNEFPILDVEGVPWHPWLPGQARNFADQWFAVVDPWFGHKAMLYSNLGTFDAMGGPGSFGTRPLWPAHPGTEPPFGHVLWQNGYATYPGIPGDVDHNQSNLTVPEFLAAIFGGITTPPTSPPAPTPAPPLSIPGTGTFRITHPTLTLGATGAAVVRLQGLVGAYPDGRYGNATRRAVVAAQGRAGLAQDGACGPLSWSAFYPVIAEGSTGFAVADVQAEVGCAADGRFGPDTLVHVEGFQRYHGLTADGICGAHTYRAMF